MCALYQHTDAFHKGPTIMNADDARLIYVFIISEVRTLSVAHLPMGHHFINSLDQTIGDLQMLMNIIVMTLRFHQGSYK